MTLRYLTLAAALVFSAAAYADGNFDRTVPAGSTPDLYVSSGSGNIHLHPGTDSQIHIAAHLHAGIGWGFGHGKDVEERIRQIVANPPIRQSGNSTYVGGNEDHTHLYDNISIDYDITAPAQVAMNLQTGSGDITTDRLGRFLKAQSGSGNVHALGLHGNAELQTGSGDIDLAESGSGNVEARSGSGTIRIHGLDGGLNARTGSGDIDAEGSLHGPAVFRSGSGSINLHLQPDARFNLDAATGSGDVRVNYPNAPQTSPDDRRHLDGPVNGGGPKLEARTGSGDISIQPR